jgi:hypothetical protein
MTFWWPSPAKAGASAPRTTRGAWQRRRHTSLTRSCPACRCASGCCRCRNCCGISCNAMARCWAWCWVFSCGSSRKPCKPTALVRRTQTRPLCTSVQSQAEPTSTDAGEGALGAGNPLSSQAETAQPVPPKRPAHDLWAVLVARIFEVFPLVCPSVAAQCASRPHACRCSGAGATRRWSMVSTMRQVGTMWPKWHRTLRLISASQRVSW